MGWVTNEYDLPHIPARYHSGFVDEGWGTEYRRINQVHWSHSGDQVALDLVSSGLHSYRVFDTVQERFHDIGDHPCFLADERLLSLKNGKAVEWCLNDTRRSYKQQPLSVDPKQYPLVDLLDGARMRVSNFQDKFNNASHINLAGFFNGERRCVMDDSRKKVLACNQDGILVWRLDVFDKKGRLEKPINIISPGNKVTNAQFNQDGDKLSIVYNEDGIQLFDFVTRRALHQVKFVFSKIKNVCYTDSGLAVALGVRDPGTKNEQRALFAIWVLGNKPTQLLRMLLQNHHGSFLSINPAGTKVLVDYPSGYLALFDLRGLHRIIRFFEREITLEQVILLNCIQWAAVGRTKKFDFRRFPHLKGYYDSLPAEVKEAIAGVVIVPK